MFTVLLIEDNIDFRQAFKDALVASLPVSVFDVGSCSSGLKFITEHSPHLTFIDINLPDGNGLELTKTIREMKPETNIIILSFVDSPEYAAAALDNGADHCISKSNMNINEISTLIESMMLTKANRKFI